MKLFKKRILPKTEEFDILAEYRDTISYFFGIVAFILIIPIAISNLVDREYVLGIAMVTAMSLIALNSLTIRFWRKPLIPVQIFLTALLGVIALSFYRRGVYGLFWTFPTVLFISFVVSHKNARLYTGIFVGYCSILTFYFVDFQIALRAFVGLVITVFFTHIFLNIIYHLRNRLVRQSISDPLTGALNRRQLNQVLGDLIERKHRSGERSTILSMDIDHFKSVNDSFGHDVGDTVIIDFVRVVKSRTRKLDQFFRVGGEEFLLVLPLAGIDAGMKIADELRIKVDQELKIGERNITVSIGVSELETGENINSWLKRADRALYAAKDGGRNRVAAAEAYSGKNAPEFEAAGARLRKVFD